MKQTKYGVFSYEDDGYTPSESPEEKTYTVYLDDTDLGQITLAYETRKGCSNAHGWTDVREGRKEWYFHQFDHEILPHSGEHPSFNINMEFEPYHFHSIKGAFKHCVEIICATLDAKDVPEFSGMAQQKHVCVLCDRLIAEHDFDMLRACFTSLHTDGLDDVQQEEWVEYRQWNEVDKEVNQ